MKFAARTWLVAAALTVPVALSGCAGSSQASTRPQTESAPVAAPVVVAPVGAVVPASTLLGGAATPGAPGAAAVPAMAPYFGDCDSVRAAGLAPLAQGRPGFNAALDGDGDGVGCNEVAAAPAAGEQSSSASNRAAGRTSAGTSSTSSGGSSKPSGGSRAPSGGSSKPSGGSSSPAPAPPKAPSGGCDEPGFFLATNGLCLPDDSDPIWDGICDQPDMYCTEG